MLDWVCIHIQDHSNRVCSQQNCADAGHGAGVSTFAWPPEIRPCFAIQSPCCNSVRHSTRHAIWQPPKETYRNKVCRKSKNSERKSKQVPYYLTTIQQSVVYMDANLVGCCTGAVQATKNTSNRLLQNSCLSTEGPGICFWVSLFSSMELCGWVVKLSWQTVEECHKDWSLPGNGDAIWDVVDCCVSYVCRMLIVFCTLCQYWGRG